MTSDNKLNLTSSHWGIGLAEIEDDKIVSVKGHPSDPDPSRINENIAGSLNGSARILRPAIRKSWLEGKIGERGRDDFVEVSWDKALDLIAGQLTHVKQKYGNKSIFAGSYGWASAGRFHHAQSQLKRFLNTIGGFVRSEGNYSYNAALVAMPHIVGESYRKHVVEATRWKVIAEHSDLVVLFGGLAMRNTQICDGGNSKHRLAGELKDCVDQGVDFVNFSPLRSDVADFLNAEWLAPKPGTDTAIMMGLAHTLLIENLHDEAFLKRYTVGFDKVRGYLLGLEDGQPKSAEWAGEISGIDAETLKTLTRRMASSRTMISCAASLQRADWGEQPLWMCVTLASMLGQIGLPGGGYTIGYAVNGHIGSVSRPFRWGAFNQGINPVKEFIPVAMVSEMLLKPGQTYRYDGQTKTLPDAKLVWWAGGNPFHHHQDLNRLRQAFQTPETIIVNEVNWTATARHADIVLPVAAAQERMDFGGGQSDNILVPMPKLVSPPAEARVEYEIYSDLASRLGTHAEFTQGRDTEEWLRHMWSETQKSAVDSGEALPDWDEFIAGDIIELPDPSPNQVFLSEFRDDPDSNPRATPSGRIELFSQTVADFDLPECKGQATWNEPHDVQSGLSTTYPLALISGQPATKIHSQLDNGAYSLSHKIKGREPVLINSDDAERRGVKSGDLVELSNSRGACIAGAVVTDDVVAGVVFLWTGAWYDPDFEEPRHRDKHGNPNVLTHDLRTSEFSQGPASHSTYVEITRIDETLSPVEAFEPPMLEVTTP